MGEARSAAVCATVVVAVVVVHRPVTKSVLPGVMVVIASGSRGGRHIGHGLYRDDDGTASWGGHGR